MNLYELKQSIKNQVKIEDIIESYGIKIDSRGKALCVFHDDKNPSMSIDKKRQIFKCFSCGEGGDVFGFVRKYEKQINKNINIKEAEVIKKIAEISNLDLNQYQYDLSNLDNELSGNYNSNQRDIIDANDLAQQLFSYSMKTKSGEVAVAYLNNRGIDEKLFQQFGLGLGIEPKDRKLIETDFKKAGLISNDYYLMKNRLTFPIHDEYGNLIAFSGRDITNKNDIKYINSKETDAFKKSNVLYNYHNAKNYVNKETDLILVEGYLDVISLAKINQNNAVASMGTALTKEQIQLIKKLNCRVHIIGDNDRPSQQAMLKNIELLQQEKIEVAITDLSKIMKNTELKDVDELIYKADSNLINQALINEKADPFEFQVYQYCKEKGLNINSNILLIQDIFKMFEDRIKTAYEENIFNNIITDFTSKNKEEIKLLFQPANFKLEQMKNTIFNQYLFDNLIKEASFRKDFIMQQYLNKATDLTFLNNILNTETFVVNTDINYTTNQLYQALETKLDYQEFKKVLTFEYPSLFDKILVYTNHRIEKGLLTQEGEKVFVSQFNIDFDSQNLDKVVDEVCIINSLEDVFEFLPTSLMSPFVFEQLKNQLENNKLSYIDFNTFFDKYEYDKFIQYLSPALKSKDGKLKRVLMYPNYDQRLEVDIKKQKKEKDKILEEERTISEEKQKNKDIKERYINIHRSIILNKTSNDFLVRIPKTNQSITIPQSLLKQNQSKQTYRLELSDLNDISFQKYENNGKDNVGKLSIEELSNHFKVFEKIKSNEIKDNKKVSNQVNDMQQIKNTKGFIVDTKYLKNSKIDTNKKYLILPLKNGEGIIKIDSKYLSIVSEHQVQLNLKDEWTLSMDVTYSDGYNDTFKVPFKNIKEIYETKELVHTNRLEKNKVEVGSAFYDEPTRKQLYTLQKAQIVIEELPEKLTKGTASLMLEELGMTQSYWSNPKYQKERNELS